MEKASILFADQPHLSSRMAEAFVARHAPVGVSAASAGANPRPLAPGVAELFAELGLKAPDARPVPLSDLAGRHFDLTVTIGLDEADASCPALPGGLVRLQWDIPRAASDSPENLRKHAIAIESAVKHFFSDGYYRALFARLASFEAIFDGLNEGIVAHGLDRRVFYFSRGAEKITGTKREEVIGRDCHELFVPRLCGDHCAFAENSGTAGLSPPGFSTVFTASDGKRKELDITRFPMKNEEGGVIGAILTLNDQTRLRELEEKLGETISFSGIIGRDHAMRAIFDLIRDSAQSDFPVIISGESGTGKELVASAIHHESNRRDKPFVAINCGALPEGILESELFGHVKGAFTGAIRDKKGRFETADTGTLFLDEIAELSPRMQVKLLRVLQDGVVEPVGSEKGKKADVRIISASNRDLGELLRRGSFREDLYYRLAVIPIRLPPLRERRIDIEPLARHFLEQTSRKLSRDAMRFSDEAMSALMNFGWPGNVRQLQNAIQFALIKCRGTMVEPGHLPPEISDAAILSGHEPGVHGKAGRKPKLSADAVERALAKAGGNKAKAARFLGVGRATLYNFLNEHKEIRTPV